MRVLITGITGYIGSMLAKKLIHCGHEVFGLVRSPVRGEYMEEIKDSVKLVASKGDYESLYLAVQQANPDIVYHLAAYYTGAHGPEDAQKLLTSNIVLGAYLLEAMSACNCNKIVCASSVMAYCNGESYSPLNLYAATKQAFCDLLSFYEDYLTLSLSLPNSP